MADKAAAFRSLTLLVAVLEETSALLADLPRGQHDALVERINGLRNLLMAELQTGRFASSSGDGQS